MLVRFKKIGGYEYLYLVEERLRGRLPRSAGHQGVGAPR